MQYFISPRALQLFLEAKAQTSLQDSLKVLSLYKRCALKPPDSGALVDILLRAVRSEHTTDSPLLEFTSYEMLKISNKIKLAFTAVVKMNTTPTPVILSPSSPPRVEVAPHVRQSLTKYGFQDFTNIVELMLTPESKRSMEYNSSIVALRDQVSSNSRSSEHINMCVKIYWENYQNRNFRIHHESFVVVMSALAKRIRYDYDSFCASLCIAALADAKDRGLHIYIETYLNVLCALALLSARRFVGSLNINFSTNEISIKTDIIRP